MMQHNPWVAFFTSAHTSETVSIIISLHSQKPILLLPFLWLFLRLFVYDERQEIKTKENLIYGMNPPRGSIIHQYLFLIISVLFEFPSNIAQAGEWPSEATSCERFLRELTSPTGPVFSDYSRINSSD